MLRLAAALDAWAREAPGRGEARIDPAVQINAHRGYVPDVAWYPRDRCPPPGEQFQGPPALVVEVLSPSTRRFDERRKLLDYARLGVDEMWLIDADRVLVRVHQRGSPAADAFDFTLAHGVERELSSSLLPGFSVRLDLLVQD